MSFDHLQSIYRNYDIRGKYPEEITDNEVEQIGRAIAKRFQVQKIAVGRDTRPSGESLFEALTKGLIESGVQIVDLGIVTTPMAQYMCGSTDVDAAVMITASHMPPEYNGLKICIEDARMVDSDVLQELRKIVGEHTFSATTSHGNIKTHALQSEWIARFKARFDLQNSGLSVVIDPANMVGVLEIDTFRAFEPDITVHSIFDELDHTCPNHEANPIKFETLEQLGEEVRCRAADLGVAFDGDADRVGIIDETGTPVPSDIIGILLAKRLLQEHPGAAVVYDIRSTKALPECVRALGGTPIQAKVGRTNISETMRKHDAVFGVELSGHFFFKESYYAEGGPLPAFVIMELLHETKKPLSELADEARKYYHSGEINSEITRTPAEVYTKLKTKFPDAEINELDGLTLSYPTWWCNVRPSANDPVMRMNLEAHTKAEMEKRSAEVLSVISL